MEGKKTRHTHIYTDAPSFTITVGTLGTTSSKSASSSSSSSSETPQLVSRKGTQSFSVNKLDPPDAEAKLHGELTLQYTTPTHNTKGGKNKLSYNSFSNKK